MVVTNRLSKDVVFILLANIKTEIVVQVFIKYIVVYY